MAGALQSAGLAAPSAHVAYSILRDDLDGVVASLRTVGCSGVVVPAFAPELLADGDCVRALAASLQSIGRRLADAGMSFALHNEESQLASLEGTTPWAMLVEATEPTLVALQLDLFTMVAAGIEPLPLIARHGHRITSLHVCDRRAGRYVPVGHGEIDWRPILDAVAATRCRLPLRRGRGRQRPRGCGSSLVRRPPPPDRAAVRSPSTEQGATHRSTAHQPPRPRGGRADPGHVVADPRGGRRPHPPCGSSGAPRACRRRGRPGTRDRSPAGAGRARRRRRGRQAVRAPRSRPRAGRPLRVSASATSCPPPASSPGSRRGPGGDATRPWPTHGPP